MNNSNILNGSINQGSALDVVIVEDEPYLAGLHRDFIEQNFNLRVVSIAATLAQAKTQLQLYRPRLVLLDNYLPDGQGIELIDGALLKSLDCSVILLLPPATCTPAVRQCAVAHLTTLLNRSLSSGYAIRWSAFCSLSTSYVMSKSSTNRRWTGCITYRPPTCRSRPPPKGLSRIRWNWCVRFSLLSQTAIGRLIRWWSRSGSAKRRGAAIWNIAWKSALLRWKCSMEISAIRDACIG